MPIVEVDEEELKRSRTLTETIAKIMADPEAKLKIQEATKKVFPNAVTPELDAVRARAESEGGVAKEMAALKKQWEDEKIEAANQRKLDALKTGIEDGLARLRRQGWTDDGIDGVRKLMEEKGLLDVQIAADHFEKQHPPVGVVSPGGQGAWNFTDMQTGETDADMQKFIDSKGESIPLLDKLINTALSDVRGQSRR